MTTTPGGSVRHAEQLPAYFVEVADEASSLWDKLEADPVLAGPWRQLFSQVQSPRHVLSELLQNADDAGATTATAAVQDGVFSFRHNGEDFKADQFRSLCRFGYSNKRTLHTIGFRGIGFKSTFSLGPDVDVLTPSLKVRFNQSRFTAPEWTESEQFSEDTHVRVRIRDEHRDAEIRKNLHEWLASPASLLFFSNIRVLEIEGQRVERRVLGPGPVPGSEWIELSSLPTHKLLIVRSEPASFPAEAVEEIRKERGAEELELPPCRVEFVLGLPGPQRLYVVLPTGVKPSFPFSCNAPFVQDPARLGIKDPAVSPANRWLLDRIGELAADTFEAWLANASLPLEERAQAYDLLAEAYDETEDVDGSVTDSVCSRMEAALDGRPVLLSEDGAAHHSNQCLAPPRPLHRVWSPDELIAMFGEVGQSLLAYAVSKPHRDRLAEWEWLEQINGDDVLNLLESDCVVPRPDSWAQLAELWQYVQRVIEYDPQGSIRRRLAICPVTESDRLWPANDVVRVSDARRGVRTDDWRFIVEGVRQLHADWMDELGNPEPGRGAFGEASRMLPELGFGDTTPLDRVIRHRADSFFNEEEIELEECVRFAHVLAALDVQVPETFEYVTRDGTRSAVTEGVVASDPALEDILPKQWADERVLHAVYSGPFEHCSRDQWESWSQGQNSGLSNLSFFERQVLNHAGWSKADASVFLRDRGVEPPERYNYRSPSFQVKDWDLHRQLKPHWTKQALDDPEIWAKVLECILVAPFKEREAVLFAEMHELYGSNGRRVQCDAFPSKWILAFRELKCLRDTLGQIHEPAALLLRSPETEPLIGVEQFVAAELDTPANRDLLLLLGARATPAGAGSILDRIRALSKAEKPPLTELGRWYDALDRVLGRRRPDDLQLIRAAFEDQNLVYTDGGEWAARGEVFQRLSEDDPPGLPTIHPEFRLLAFWSVIGVAERPSADLLIDYASSLETDQKLDGGQLKRVRAILREQPVRIWNECGHWLTIDGHWRRTDDISLALFDDASVRVRDLFPAVKSAAADCRSLREDARGAPCFAGLEDLAARLTYRPQESELVGADAHHKPWLEDIGNLFARIRLEDDTLESRVRAAGQRLGRTRWRAFQSLHVLPYLDGSPAGQPHEPVVLWDDTTLFVKSATPARVCDAVIAELSRYFPSEPIQRALRSCYERSATFIEDYLAEQFEFDEPLETEDPESTPHAGDPDEQRPIEEDNSESGFESDADLDHAAGLVDAEATGAPSRGDEPQDAPIEAVEQPPEPRIDPWTGEPVVEAGRDTDLTADGVDSDVSPETGVDGVWHPQDQDPGNQDPETHTAEPDPEPKPDEPEPAKARPLIARFAEMQGFRPTDDKHIWTHLNGTELRHTRDIFPWVHQDGGHVIHRYWFTDQSLVRSGIELNAEVWEMLKQNPQRCSFVMAEGDQPTVLPGATVLRMVQDESLELFPSRYRLRRPHD